MNSTTEEREYKIKYYYIDDPSKVHEKHCTGIDLKETESNLKDILGLIDYGLISIESRNKGESRWRIGDE